MKNSRDDFRLTTRRVLAERVAWKCSFPGCDVTTVGPDSGDSRKSVNNGIAAHIHAAGKGGPRFRDDMTREERRDIENGIWMCRHHGNLVDADFTEYSADTLRTWRTAAEKRAAENLRLPTSSEFPDGSTMIQIGRENIFHATWSATHVRKWSFVLKRPELGTLDTLREYVSCFDSIPESDSYIVVESQGDARRVNKIRLRVSSEGQHILEVIVRRRVPPTDPNSVADLKLGDDGDLSPRFEIIRGVEAAKQTIMLATGVRRGEIPWAKDVGSSASEYYQKYRNDLKMLARLIKIELIR